MLDRKIFIVSGRVQGVFFRKHTQRAALKIGGVSGWVRNLTNGQAVEVYAEGSPQAVASLAQWCRDKGSPRSRVSSVDIISVNLSTQTVDGGFDSNFETIFSRITSAEPKRGEEGAVLLPHSSFGNDDAAKAGQRLCSSFFIAVDAD